jgi:hypothetical protein
MLNRRRIVSALICSALVAAAPASARAQDLRAPDQQVQTATPWSDLRSPDVQAYGDPVPATPEPVAETVGRDGIAPLPFVLSLAGALIAGIGVAGVVHRRHAIH